MAEQTTSSIVIDADPATIMEVIGDFPSYPAWAKGVRRRRSSSEFADGWAERVFFPLDVPPIKDEYTLAVHLGRVRRRHLVARRGQGADRTWTGPTCCATWATAPPR